MSDQPPRSAFEIAMERLRQKDVEDGVERRPVTDRQKAEIAEVRSICEAKLAQEEVMHRSELARTADPEAREALQKQYHYSRERLVSERDAKIDRIRSEKGTAERQVEPIAPIMSLSSKDLDDLRYARMLLEHPSFATKLINVIGTPIERGLEMLPANWSAVVGRATRTALQKALDLAISTMDDRGVVPPSDTFHKIAATITGAVGGAMGFPGLAVELPLSTMVILRSIADVARSEGERIKAIPSKLACIEVFALGGRSKTDDAAETSYFAVRAALAGAVREAADFIAEKGIAQEGAPAVVKLIAQIASRFDVAVSEKAAAQAMPIVGAAGGAVINLLFVDHCQNMARGHFTVRRLERQHGADEVRNAYGALRLGD